MKSHLVLDVVAWIWAVVFTLMVINGMLDLLVHQGGNFIQTEEGKMFIFSLILATICFAWIIAG